MKSEQSVLDSGEVQGARSCCGATGSCCSRCGGCRCCGCIPAPSRWRGPSCCLGGRGKGGCILFHCWVVVLDRFTAHGTAFGPAKRSWLIFFFEVTRRVVLHGFFQLGLRPVPSGVSCARPSFLSDQNPGFTYVRLLQLWPVPELGLTTVWPFRREWILSWWLGGGTRLSVIAVYPWQDRNPYPWGSRCLRVEPCSG